MSALEKMREAFETCTVMAGVEPDFECIYITKDGANALFDEAEAENAKLRELAADMLKAMRHLEEGAGMDVMVGYSPWFAPKLHELGIEVGA